MNTNSNDHQISFGERLSLTIADAVQYSGMSESTIFGLLRDGKLQRRKLGRKTLILRSELDEFIRTLPTAA